MLQSAKRKASLPLTLSLHAMGALLTMRSIAFLEDSLAGQIICGLHVPAMALGLLAKPASLRFISISESFFCLQQQRRQVSARCWHRTKVCMCDRVVIIACISSNTVRIETNKNCSKATCKSHQECSERLLTKIAVVSCLVKKIAADCCLLCSRFAVLLILLVHRRTWQQVACCSV